MRCQMFRIHIGYFGPPRASEADSLSCELLPDAGKEANLESNLASLVVGPSHIAAAIGRIAFSGAIRNWRIHHDSI